MAKNQLTHKLLAMMQRTQWFIATLAGMFLALTFFVIQASRILQPWERTRPFFLCGNVMIVAVISLALFLAHLPYSTGVSNTKKRAYKWIATWFIGIALGVFGGGVMGIAMPIVSYVAGKADTLATSTAGIERAFNLALATFFATLLGTVGALVTTTMIEIIKRKTESA